MTVEVAPMTVEEHNLLNELLTNTYGLHFPESKRELLESRLRPRLKALRLPRAMDYYLMVRYDRGDEALKLATLATNNETYFFRETYQFDAFFRQGLRELRERTRYEGPLQVLSAGCSSGDEVYTLNIYAKEDFFGTESDCLDIHAIDIDLVQLDKARDAEYGPNSFRAAREDQIRRYFKEVAPGTYRLRTGYRDGVSFGFGNIVDYSSLERPVQYHAIFCRNVIIYFAGPALQRAIENFARILRPGGLLFLGHSESLVGLTDLFETVRLGSCIVYRRVGT